MLTPTSLASPRASLNKSESDLGTGAHRILYADPAKILCPFVQSIIYNPVMPQSCCTMNWGSYLDFGGSQTIYTNITFKTCDTSKSHWPLSLGLVVPQKEPFAHPEFVLAHLFNCPGHRSMQNLMFLKIWMKNSRIYSFSEVRGNKWLRVYHSTWRDHSLK